MGRRATLIVLLAFLVAAGAEMTPADARPLITTSVLPTDRAVPIAPHFLGLSYELSQSFPALGNSARINEPYVRLLGHLTATGSGAPVLRIAGGSADEAWWNPSGAPRPRGIAFDLGPGYFDAIRLLQRATGAPLILGLNMASGDPSIAADLAREAMARLDAGT